MDERGTFVDELEQGQHPFGNVDEEEHPRWDPSERRIFRYDEVEQPPPDDD